MLENLIIKLKEVIFKDLKKSLRKQLLRESKLVSKNSLEILKEFESVDYEN